MLALIPPFMNYNSTPKKIIVLDLRVCMQSVSDFRRLQWMYVGILVVQITFKLGFFLLAFKCFQAGKFVWNFNLLEVCGCVAPGMNVGYYGMIVGK